MTQEQLIQRYGRRIYQVLSEDIDKVRNLASDGIRVILSALGVTFDWRHSPEPFGDFLLRLECTETARAELQRLWEIVSAAEEECLAIYRCVTGRVIE